MVGLGLGLALTGLGRYGLFGHLLFTLSRFNGRLHFGLFFGQLLVFQGLLLLETSHFGTRSFSYACAPRLFVQPPANGRLGADGAGFAVLCDAVKALAACFHTGLHACKTVGVLLAPCFFLSQKGIALAHRPLDFPVLGARLWAVHVKPLDAHTLQLQSRSHAFGLGLSHGGQATEPRGTQSHVVVHNLKLGTAHRGAGIDHLVVDPLGFAAPSDHDRFGVLRRDVNAGLKVRGTHFALQTGLTLDRNFQMAQLFGVLHPRSHHHAVGLLCQQLVLPGHDRHRRGQPRQKGGHKAPELQGAFTK